jgi:hypothetical protein
VALFLCEPPPGFDLPEYVIEAPSKSSALIRLGHKLKRDRWHMRHADVNYRITIKGV